jgi:hypothetical protein
MKGIVDGSDLKPKEVQGKKLREKEERRREEQDRVHRRHSGMSSSTSESIGSLRSPPVTRSLQ